MSVNIDTTKYQKLGWIKCNVTIPTDADPKYYGLDIIVECDLKEDILSIDGFKYVDGSEEETSHIQIGYKYRDNTYLSPCYYVYHGDSYQLATRTLPNKETLIQDVAHKFRMYDDSSGFNFSVDDLVTYSQKYPTITNDDELSITITNTGKVYSIWYCGYHCNDRELVPVKRLSDNKIGFYEVNEDNFYEVTDVTDYDGKYNSIDFTNVKALEIPEGKVVRLDDKDGNTLWSNLDKYAYGIRWTTDGGTACERIGNLDFHKTLPIQSKFKCCVHQGTNIQYYLNHLDSRFVEESKRTNFTYQGSKMNVTACDGLPSGVTSCEENSEVKCKFVNTELFSNYRFLYSYVFVKSNENTDRVAIGRIVYIDTDKGEAYIDDSSEIQVSEYVYKEESFRYNVSSIVDDDEEEFTNDCTIELGASLNGYDGELGVDTGGKFYQWSIDRGGVGTGNEVWISEHKCVSYAKEVKRHIIGCSKACVLNVAFNDSKWGWIGSLTANTAVNVVNYNSNLRGGINGSEYDKQLGIDNFRCQFNKGITILSIATMRTYTQKLANHQVLYKQLWEAIVWCWCIEYAQLDVKKDYNANLDSNGYHQGGLGKSYSVGGNSFGIYNNNQVFTPNDYTLHLGNSTGIRTRTARIFKVASSANSAWNSWIKSGVGDVTKVDDNDNKTKIGSMSVGAYLQVVPTIVSGIHIYKVEGLTDGQYLVFNREQGNLTITADGTYEVNWGHNNVNRKISFGKAQTTCEIILTIVSAPSSYVNYNQVAWDIPHWRGFNAFWYGDILINIENFLSKYNADTKTRTYYWTDDITKFSSSIDNKEHQVEVADSATSHSIHEFVLGKTGNIISDNINSNNKNNAYLYTISNTTTNVTYIGGDNNARASCSLFTMDIRNNTKHSEKNRGFVTCTIID